MSLKSAKEAYRESVYKKAIEKYGETHQFVVAMEEMAELIKELSKRVRYGENRVGIIEEIADVEVVLDQIKAHLGVTRIVEELKEMKIERLSGVLVGQKFEDMESKVINPSLDKSKREVWMHKESAELVTIEKVKPNKLYEVEIDSCNYLGDLEIVTYDHISGSREEIKQHFEKLSEL